MDVVQQTNAGWDDAIPWAAGNYHLTYGRTFAGSYSWNLTDPPAGREGIKLHQGSINDPSGPVHGCIGASANSFLKPVYDALNAAGVLNDSIACEVNNNFNYSISIACGSAVH